ncbi:hypothetical protein BGX30_009402, partial [Mortierella sp. GBA39]
AQKLEAKRWIESWRHKELSTVAGESESYVLETVMDDRAVDRLSAKFGRISTYDSVNNIIDWSEWITGSRKRLVDMLVALNHKFDNPTPKDTDNPPPKDTDNPSPKDTNNPPTKDMDNPPPNYLDYSLPEDLGDGFDHSSSDDSFHYL